MSTTRTASLAALFPVPGEVNRRAWECAWDMASHHMHLLSAAELDWCQWDMGRGEDAAREWPAVGQMLRLHADVRERRA